MTEENVAGVILKEKLAFKNNVDKIKFLYMKQSRGEVVFINISSLQESDNIIWPTSNESQCRCWHFSVKWNNLKMTVFPFIFDVKSYL